MNAVLHRTVFHTNYPRWLGCGTYWRLCKRCPVSIFSMKSLDKPTPKFNCHISLLVLDKKVTCSLYWSPVLKKLLWWGMQSSVFVTMFLASLCTILSKKFGYRSIRMDHNSTHLLCATPVCDPCHGLIKEWCFCDKYCAFEKKDVLLLPFLFPVSSFSSCLCTCMSKSG